MWNEGLSIQGSVETGHIDPVFVVDTEDPWVDSMLMGSNVIQVGNLSFQGGKISVEATAAAGNTLNYSFAVKNYGTVPVKIVTAQYPFDSLWVTVRPEDGDESVIDPDKTVKGNIRIEIPPGTEPGDYYLDLDINCIQWNGDPDEPEDWWNQPLRVEGEINVPVPEISVVMDNSLAETDFSICETVDGLGSENDLTEQSITNEIQEVVE